jgi:D-Tyr-tRNAtyr deacylase
MRCVIQRVNSASVSVDGVLISAIDRGYCLLVGLVSENDYKRSHDGLGNRDSLSLTSTYMLSE